MSDGTADGGSAVGSGMSGGEQAAGLGTGAPDADDGSLPAGIESAGVESGVDAEAGADEAALPDLDRDSVPPEEAFAALGNEVRTAVLDALADADGPVAFSDLLDASPMEESAGFAYHLRQLTGHFVRKVADEEAAEEGDGKADRVAGYVLTAAGRRMARALRAGTYTDRVSFEPIGLDDPCPFCGGGLVARGIDGDVTVGCGDCGRPVLRLPMPPGAVEERGIAEALSALERHHRRRLGSMADGVCPDCGGVVNGSVAGVGDEVNGGGNVRAVMRCRGCGTEMAAPVTLAVQDHPAVVALYHRHGEDTRERPIWNVGSEWRETVVSKEPWLVRVKTVVGGEELVLYVDGGLEVIGSEQAAS